MLQRLWKAYETYKLLRWVIWVSGIIISISGVAIAGVIGYVNRMREKLLTDAPEYATDTTILPFHMTDWLNRIRQVVNPAFIQTLWTDHTFNIILLSILLLILLTIRIILIIPLGKPDNPFDRDPRRQFTTADEQWIKECANGRCEHRYCFGLFRCHASYAKGNTMHHDHHYPWSKGGATSRRNLVLLCAKHNLRKSDRLPRFVETWLLAKARLHYFPPRYRGYIWPDGTTIPDREDAHSVSEPNMSMLQDDYDDTYDEMEDEYEH